MPLRKKIMTLQNMSYYYSLNLFLKIFRVGIQHVFGFKPIVEPPRKKIVAAV